MSAPFLLPRVLDLGAAGPLWSALAGLRGQSLTLDASEVERFGGLCLQVLLAARTAWAGDGFQIINPSPAFCAGAELMGAANLCGAKEAP